MNRVVKANFLAIAAAAAATNAIAAISYTLDEGQAHSSWAGLDSDKPCNWDVPSNWSDNTVPVVDTWRNVHFNLSSATTIDYGSKYSADNASFSIIVDAQSAPLTITQSNVPLRWYATGRDGVARTSFVNLSSNHAVFNISVIMYGYRNYNSGIHPGAEFNRSFEFTAVNPLFVFFAGDGEAQSDDVNTTIFRSDFTSTKPVSIEANHIVKLDGSSASMTASGNSIDVAGTLQVIGGSVTCDSLSVAEGGTLGGSGTINGAVSGTSGAVLDFTAKTALTFAGSADLTGFTIAASDLDASEAYVVARGTTSLPVVPTALQSEGWMAKAQDGNVVLVSTTRPITENVTLDDDADWSDSFIAVDAGVTIDLNGHELRVAGVSLGSGASFVNSGAKANLVIGCNGGDKSFIFGTTLPSSILPVFTGASIEIPDTFIPAGGIGFADSAAVQTVATGNCANGLCFLGNANVRGNEWIASCSFPVTVEGENNVMTLSGGDWDTYEAFVGTPFHGSGVWKLTTDRATQNITIGSKERDNSNFSGRIILDRGAMNANRDYNIRLEDDNNLANALKNGTIVLNNDNDSDATFKLVSQNWGTNPTYDWASLETSGAHPERVILKANRNNWDDSKFSTLKIGRGGGTGEGVFAGAISNDNTSAASRIYIEKYGTGTWTLSGLVSPGGTFTVAAGTVDFAGATVADVAGITVSGGARLKGTSSIPAAVPVTLEANAVLSGGLTLHAAPAVTTAKYVPVFTSGAVEKLVLDYDSPSLAAFTLEVETIPVVPAGTEFVLAEGPVGSSIVAPTLGTTAVEAGWEVRAEGNQVILTSTKLPPLEISGEFSLSDDYDYSTGTINVADGAVIDLCGHTLKVGVIAFAGTVRFVNSADNVANLVAGCEDNDKTWLWTTADMTLDSGVRAVVTGAAVEIPAAFVPAGGIGFMDTTGDVSQSVAAESCAYGVAFLGSANVTEPSKSWQNGTFSVAVYGTNNVFTFNADNTGSRDATFAQKPFIGDGTLTLRPNDGIHTSYAIGNENIDNSSFTGTLILEYGANFTWPIEFPHPSNKPNLHFPNATVALCAKVDGSASQYVLHSVNGSSTANFCFDSLVTEGDNAANVSLFTSCTSSGGTVLRIGCNGNGGGVFAGTFTNYDGTVEKPYSIEKNGTNVWTLTGTVANGGNITVNAGIVCFNSGLANVTQLTVASGATAGFCGDMGAASAMNLAAGSKVLLDVGAAARAGGNSTDWVPVVDGDLDLSGVGVVVKQGSWTGNRSRDLLRVTGTLTVDLAQIETDLDTQHFKFQVRNGNTLRYQSTRGLVISLR